jgi:hypothetical protein
LLLLVLLFVVVTRTQLKLSVSENAELAERASSFAFSDAGRKCRLILLNFASVKKCIIPFKIMANLVADIGNATSVGHYIGVNVSVEMITYSSLQYEW